MEIPQIPQSSIKPGPVRPKPRKVTTIKPVGKAEDIYQPLDLSLSVVDRQGEVHMDLDKTYEFARTALDSAKTRIIINSSYERWSSIKNLIFNISKHKWWHFWNWFRCRKFGQLKQHIIDIQKSVKEDNLPSKEIDDYFDFSGLSLS